jgi:hypothetical protein
MMRFPLRMQFPAALLISAFVVGCAPRAERAVAPPVEEGFIETADGTKLFYRKVGDGPQPVILPADLFLHPAFD